MFSVDRRQFQEGVVRVERGQTILGIVPSLLCVPLHIWPLQRGFDLQDQGQVDDIFPFRLQKL